jgi:hypothetical protein
MKTIPDIKGGVAASQITRNRPNAAEAATPARPTTMFPAPFELELSELADSAVPFILAVAAVDSTIVDVDGLAVGRTMQATAELDGNTTYDVTADDGTWALVVTTDAVTVVPFTVMVMGVAADEAMEGQTPVAADEAFMVIVTGEATDVCTTCDETAPDVPLTVIVVAEATDECWMNDEDTPAAEVTEG